MSADLFAWNDKGGLEVIPLPATIPIPDSSFYRQMKEGHLIRFGHELTGVLVDSSGSGIFELVRSCEHGS